MTIRSLWGLVAYPQFFVIEHMDKTYSMFRAAPRRPRGPLSDADLIPFLGAPPRDSSAGCYRVPADVADHYDLQLAPPEDLLSPQAKSDRKRGVAVKSYKLPIAVTDAFASACQARGVPMGTALTALMEAYIADTPADDAP